MRVGSLAPMRVPTPAAQLVRGFAMGSADIVPGVSGGTVALVLGIYDRLIDNISAGAHALKQLITADFALEEGYGRTPDVLEGMMSAEDVAEIVLFVVTRPRGHRILETAIRPMKETSWG